MEQLTSQLLSVNHTKPDGLLTVVRLTAQINAIGMLKHLPEAVRQFKEQLDQVDKIQEARQAEAFDPLNKE